MKRDFISFKRLADFLKIAMVLSLVFYISSCNNDNDDPDPMPEPDPGLVDAANDAGLTILLDALTEADLASALAADENLTIFAPTNAAFTEFLNAIGQTSLEDIPEDVLVDVLQYHVVDAGAPIASGDLDPSQDVTTLGGEELSITVSGGTVTLNPDTDNATVGTADVSTESGIVHVIDKVLVPPSIRPVLGTIVAPAYFNNNFTTLIAAVNAADEANPDANILETLLSNGPSDNGLTLFAPTNEAFEAAGITDLSAVADIVVDVLTYHLIDGTFEAADVLGLDPAQAATVNGEEVFFSAVGDDLFINGRTQVTTADIDGSNGVVHVINRTLVPPTQTIAGIVTELADEGAGEFTVLLELLGDAADLPDGTSLVEFLSDASQEFTVFAPTDAAFAAADQTLLGSLSPEQVRDVILYHVVGNAVFSTDLADDEVPTLLGDPAQEITIDATNLTIGDATDDLANIVPGDNAELINVLATNGVIHTIDKVLIPQL
ncbi:MAG: fasciclin domain-containing protein [Cyclobacteriaceae bacterium]